MRIDLSPQRLDDALVVSKIGDVLTVNGEEFDFSSLPDGATIPPGTVPCAWITGPVHRIDGQVRITLVLPIGPQPTEAQAFPAAIEDVADGRIALPIDEVADVDA